MGRAGRQAGAAAARRRSAGPAARSAALQAFRVLQHLLNEGGHGAGDLHLQGDDSLGSCRLEMRKNEFAQFSLLFIKTGQCTFMDMFILQRTLNM